MHEIQSESDANGWENADADARGTMGYAFEARQPNAAGIDRPVLLILQKFHSMEIIKRTLRA